MALATMILICQVRRIPQQTQVQVPGILRQMQIQVQAPVVFRQMQMQV